MTVGKSDFALQGKASNYLAYYLKDEPLEANFVHMVKTHSGPMNY